jgi:hypothetical protein
MLWAMGTALDIAIDLPPAGGAWFSRPQLPCQEIAKIKNKFRAADGQRHLRSRMVSIITGDNQMSRLKLKKRWKPSARKMFFAQVVREVHSGDLYWFECSKEFDLSDGIPADAVMHGPFKTDDEVKEHQRVTLLGPQCEVTECTPPKLFMEEVSARNSETGRDELYLVADGQRIAQRGYDDALQEMTWIVTAIGRSRGFSFDVPDDGALSFCAGEVQLMPEPKGAVH